jgi:hypothetical protein
MVHDLPNSTCARKRDERGIVLANTMHDAVRLNALLLAMKLAERKFCKYEIFNCDTRLVTKHFPP